MTQENKMTTPKLTEAETKNKRRLKRDKEKYQIPEVGTLVKFNGIRYRPEHKKSGDNNRDKDIRAK